MLYLALTLSSVNRNEDACVCVCMLSHVWLVVTPWPVDAQAPLFMESPRHEYWSGWPFPTPGYFPDPSLFLQNLSPEQGVSHQHSPRLRLRAHLGVGMRSGGKEGKRVLLRVCNVGKHEAGLQEEGLPRWLLRWQIWLPPFGTKLKGRKIRKVAVTDHALNPGAHCCRGWGLVFQVGCCRAGPRGWKERFPNFPVY